MVQFLAGARRCAPARARGLEERGNDASSGWCVFDEAARPRGGRTERDGARRPLESGWPWTRPETGPAALRATRLLARLQAAGLTPVDWGDVDVPPPDVPAVRGLRNPLAVAALARILAERVGTALDDGLLPLVLGGDHSISLGTIAASAARGPIGVLWLDAHGDFNTPDTSPSGNIYGMVLAILAGLGAPSLVECVGTPIPGSRIRHHRRPLPRLGRAAESARRRRRGLHHRGDTGAGASAGHGAGARRASAAGAEQVHVSLDLDMLDPSVAPGVWTRAADGLTVRRDPPGAARGRPERATAGARRDRATSRAATPRV